MNYQVSGFRYKYTDVMEKIVVSDKLLAFDLARDLFKSYGSTSCFWIEEMTEDGYHLIAKWGIKDAS